MERIRIGAGVGFYGDSFLPALEIIRQGAADFVCFEDLAELTLAILQKDRSRNPQSGYTKDLLPMLEAGLPDALRNHIRIIANAGGLNPQAAGQAVRGLAKKLGLALKVAVVSGDNILDRLPSFLPFSHMETGESLPEQVRERALFANVYLGAWPIVQALQQGADVVITGRVADPSLFLAPLVYGFGWDWDDWDRLALGTVVGHLLECSSQVTGGNHGGHWDAVAGLDQIGFPIADVTQDDQVIITKLPHSGGKISADTVREQLLYEIHDPTAYITPDVVVNVSGAHLEDLGNDRVKVSGIKGGERPARYKALLGYEDGYMGQGMLGYSWPDALKKAQATEKIMRNQMARLNLPVEEIRAEYLGYNSLHGPLASAQCQDDLNEVYLRLAVRTPDRRAAEQISRLMVPLALGGPPTASGLIGVDRVRGLTGLWPSLVERHAVDQLVTVSVEEVTS